MLSFEMKDSQKEIKIDFVDFYRGFNKKDNDFYNILSERYHVRIASNPDYIFFSCFGHDYVKYDCVRIFYTGECLTPNFNECDYAIAFDRMNFGDRYCRVPLYRLLKYGKETLELENRGYFTEEDLRQKEGFCSFVYSNCFAQDKRTEIFNKLSQYKKVASGGRYKNNIGGAIRDKRNFQKKYKFSVAFENTSYDGYATEKLTEAFLSNAIPIYYGDPNITMDFNERAFINCHKYKSLEDVVAAVMILDQDDQMYIEMLNQPIFNDKIKNDGLRDFLFHIFEQKYEDAFRRPFSLYSKAYEDMILRHRFFEDNIYKYYAKIRNQVSRIGKDTLLTRKRIK